LPGRALDLIEQQGRIDNLAADTALQLQTLAIAKAQVFIALLTFLVALGGAMTLYDMEQRHIEFEARLKQASKPLTGVIMAAVATAAAILGGAVALAVILPKFFPNLQ